MGQMKIQQEIIKKVNAYIANRRRRIYENGEKNVHSEGVFGRRCYIEKFSGRMSDKMFTQLKAKLAKKEESFAERLLRLIDESGMTDAEVYKRAGIDRKYFSKLRNEKERIPKTKVVYAFIFALRLSLGEDINGNAIYSGDSYRNGGESDYRLLYNNCTTTTILALYGPSGKDNWLLNDLSDEISPYIVNWKLKQWGFASGLVSEIYDPEEH